MSARVVIEFDLANAAKALAVLRGSLERWLVNADRHSGEILNLSHLVDGVMRHWGATDYIGTITIRDSDDVRIDKSLAGRVCPTHRSIDRGPCPFCESGKLDARLIAIRQAACGRETNEPH